MNVKKTFWKKKQVIIFIALIILAIVSIVLFAQTKDEPQKPSKELIAAVEAEWDAAKAEEQPKYLSKLDEIATYTLESVQLEDDRYVIKATVKSPDLGGRLASIETSEFPQTNDEEEINEFLCEQIEKAEMKKYDVRIFAYNINGKYYITFSEDFADAMSGNLYTYSQKTFVELLQKYKEGELK